MAKKTFKTAATNFITTTEPEEVQAGSGKASGKKPAADPGKAVQVPKGFKLVPETKDARIQLLLKPSIKEGLRRAAHENYTSINNLVNDILQEWLERREANEGK